DAARSATTLDAASRRASAEARAEESLDALQVCPCQPLLEGRVAECGFLLRKHHEERLGERRGHPGRAHQSEAPSLGTQIRQPGYGCDRLHERFGQWRRKGIEVVGLSPEMEERVHAV